jgi:hypothetical protein
LFLYSTVTADGGYCSTFEADYNTDAHILARMRAAFPHVDKDTFLMLGAVQEGDSQPDLSAFQAVIKPEPDEGHEGVGLDTPFYVKTDASSSSNQFDADIVGKLKPAGGVEGEEGEEEAGYHGLENMNLDEPFDAEASGDEDSEDGVGELMETGDCSFHDGEADEDSSDEDSSDEEEDDDDEETDEQEAASDPMALCTTTTIAAGGRPRRERKAPTIFDPSEYDSKMPHKKPRKPTTARTTAQAAKKTHRAAQPRSPSTKKGKASQENHSQEKKPKSSRLVQHPIVGMLTDEARRFASFTGASDDMLPLIVKSLLREAVRRMYEKAFGSEAPPTLNIDDPATRANIIYMFKSVARSYNIDKFNPKKLIKKFESKKPAPKNLLCSRNLLDLNVNMGTGTCSLYQRGR